MPAICKALFLLLLTGCGYHWQPDYPHHEIPTVYVPLIEGDEDGALTSAVIQKLHTSHLVKILRNRGDYRLHVVIKGGEEKTIGFRRDIELIKDKPTKNLIASEARKSVEVEVILFEGDSQRIAYGPYVITADADYDYVMEDALQDLTFVPAEGSPSVIVLPFSLGQLESHEAAREAATKPIYSRLAQKIVDAIAAEW